MKRVGGRLTFRRYRRRLFGLALSAVMVWVWPVSNVAARTPARADRAPATGQLSFDNADVLRDTLGVRVNAHDGGVLVAGTGGSQTFYLYGTDYGCLTPIESVLTSYCGVRMYRSTDFHSWTDLGWAFNPFTPIWQLRCAPPIGCFRPHVVFNPRTNLYVMWLNTNDPGYTVLLAPSPVGPWTEVPVKPVLHVSDGGNGYVRYGDENLFVDGDGTGYIVYTVIGRPNTHDIAIEQLDSDFITGTGVTSRLGLQFNEAPTMFSGPDGAYYIAYSNPARAFGITDTDVVMAASPFGPYSPPAVLIGRSCEGQPSDVITVPTSSGPLYLFASDRWVDGSWSAQSAANNYYSPLGFDAQNRLTTMACEASWEHDR